MCFTTSRVALLTVAALQLQGFRKMRDFNPGAGIGVTSPGATVHKDGMMWVECLQDEMYEEADKYGENRHSYVNKFNVSIVRYADVVDREKKRDMTPQVCFDFCRTIHDMHYFGLKEGRTCYCTPYYERKTSGGGVCDLPCEGDSAKTCGGKEMIDMYEMHMCANTKEDIEKSGHEGGAVQAMAANAGEWGKRAAQIFEEAADQLMLEANKLGDMSSHDLAQKMKVHSGVVLHAAEAAEASGTALLDALDAMGALSHNDFTIPDNIYEAEAALRDVAKLSEKAQADGEASTKINEKFFPNIDDKHAMEGATLFVSVMDMIERWQSEHGVNASHAELYPTTCEGEFAADPIVGLSMEECAEACNVLAPANDENYCVGFQYFHMGEMKLYPQGTYAGGGCEDLPGHDYYYYGSCQNYLSRTDRWYNYYISWADYYESNGNQERHDRYTDYATTRYGDREGDPEGHTCGEDATRGRRWVLASGTELSDELQELADTPLAGRRRYRGYANSLKMEHACCQCGGGQEVFLPRPDTGLCMLFKSIDHVYKYDCGDTEWCEDVDYSKYSEPGKGAPGWWKFRSEDEHKVSLQNLCKRFAENPNRAAGAVANYYYDGTFRDPDAKWGYQRRRASSNTGVADRFAYYYGVSHDAPRVREGCCAVKEMFPDGYVAPEGRLLAQQRKKHKEARAARRSGANATNATKLSKALLSKEESVSQEKRKYRNEELNAAHVEYLKKKNNPFEGYPHQMLSAPPKGLTTANVCKVRGSWMIAAPRKPEFEKLNTCLDTGDLVLPS